MVQAVKECESKQANPNGIFFNEMLFLIQLALTDTVPIITILLYHLLTLRNSEAFKPRMQSQVSSRFDKLYELDEDGTNSSMNDSGFKLNVSNDRSKSPRFSSVDAPPNRQNQELGDVENLGDSRRSRTFADDRSALVEDISELSSEQGYDYGRAVKSSGWLKTSPSDQN